MQGRVFSVRRLIAQFTSPLSVALLGVLLTLLAALVAAMALAQLVNPSLRRAEDRE